MRKKYAEEYKNAAVNMVLIEGKSPTEVAHNLGICVSLLHKWIRKHKGMDSKGKLSNSEEEIKRLKKERLYIDSKVFFTRVESNDESRAFPRFLTL
jgi:transposase-like protein